MDRRAEGDGEESGRMNERQMDWALFANNVVELAKAAGIEAYVLAGVFGPQSDEPVVGHTSAYIGQIKSREWVEAAVDLMDGGLSEALDGLAALEEDSEDDMVPQDKTNFGDVF